MGWRHPDIALQELMVCVRAFVDILILTGGYQSTAHPALWDSQSIHRALQWSLFFQAVLEKLPASEEGNASKQELDKALLDLTSDPLFPQGLPQLSVAALTESKKLLLGNLLQAVNLRENHLSSLLTVAHEIDSSDLGDNSKTSVSSNGVYRFSGNELEVVQQSDIPISIHKQNDNLKKQADVLVSRSPHFNFLEKETINKGPDSKEEFPKTESGKKSIHHGGVAGSNKNSKNWHSDYVIQEITERHAAVTCTKSLEEGLIVLADSVLQKKEVGSEHQIWDDNSDPVSTSSFENWTWDIQLWRQRKDTSLSYLLDKRTLSVVSGASLIFNSTKPLWSHILESLKGPTDNMDDPNTLEKVELCLLGLTLENWNYIIRKFTSATYRVISLSKIWHYLQNIRRENGVDLYARKENIDFKSREIEGYLLQLLANKMEILWKMPSVLVASSLHLRSMGLRRTAVYNRELKGPQRGRTKIKDTKQQGTSKTSGKETGINS
ncbi:uncharacterized protein LOC131043896 isoform X2 [Cryptomeria japonica]|uniref:uncharacterized protein LOC131043896 isoform X2 n=1 Tax=Cryptomeria japonica TaxID=3369 RepID=UPI0025AD20CB|nr:uncharacterized protein LOC131043896 isoform X2 [Cryptomeria japonica]